MAENIEDLRARLDQVRTWLQSQAHGEDCPATDREDPDDPDSLMSWGEPVSCECGIDALWEIVGPVPAGAISGFAKKSEVADG